MQLPQQDNSSLTIKMHTVQVWSFNPRTNLTQIRLRDCRRKVLSQQLLFAIVINIFACSLTVAEDGKRALLTLSNGDMRKVLNVLQSTWLAYKEVTEDTVYTCVGHPLKRDIENIVKWLLNEDFQAAFKSN